MIKKFLFKLKLFKLRDKNKIIQTQMDKDNLPSYNEVTHHAGNTVFLYYRQIVFFNLIF